MKSTDRLKSGYDKSAPKQNQVPYNKDKSSTVDPSQATDSTRYNAKNACRVKYPVDPNGLVGGPKSKIKDAHPELNPASDLGVCTSIAADLLTCARKSADSSSSIPNKVNTKIESLRDLALEKTLQALGLITIDKLLDANLDDLSKVAFRLSQIAIPKFDSTEDNSKINITIYAPEQKLESSYKTIEVLRQRNRNKYLRFVLHVMVEEL